MKAFLISLLLLVGFTAQATYIPQVETQTVAGVVLDYSKANFKVLYGVMGQTTNWATLRENTASAGYVVPVGKTFKILAVSFSTDGTAGPIYLAYGDNDVGFATATPPTNVTYAAGGTGTGQRALSTSTAGESSSAPAYFQVPTGKYPAFAGPGGAGGTAGQVQVYGYEE